MRMIQKVFGDNEMSAAQIRVWHKHFKDDQEAVGSDPRSGRLETSRTPEEVECVRAAVSKGRRLTVCEPEAELGIPNTAALPQTQITLKGGRFQPVTEIQEDPTGQRMETGRTV